VDLEGKTVKFSALSSNGELVNEVKLGGHHLTTGSLVHTIAAQELIKELEDEWNR